MLSTRLFGIKGLSLIILNFPFSFFHFIYYSILVSNSFSFCKFITLEAISSKDARQSWNIENVQIIQHHKRTVQDQLQIHQETQDGREKRKRNFFRSTKKIWMLKQKLTKLLIKKQPADMFNFRNTDQSNKDAI
ncbi:hypothetical protein CAEBREN_11057 [Caenorhabditis brenneri]|uniref:Uncharacterized protein n=1 Tax=Caenorhabditis brenneri TaxID=135651 RepID=G0NI23_CAEBE|nr:hypothetical protein CAEBREN_11057 [Caenorhabditis brenneri]